MIAILKAGVPQAQIDNLIDKVEDASGVEVQRYDILFEGVCQDCRQAKIS